jgi:hypothetical protein
MDLLTHPHFHLERQRAKDAQQARNREPQLSHVTRRRRFTGALRALRGRFGPKTADDIVNFGP